MDRIKILNDYMKSLDERLFVQKNSRGEVFLFFIGPEKIYNFGLAYIKEKKLKQLPVGTASEDLFNELLQYKDDFFKKYNELYNKGLNQEMESKK